MTSHWRILYRSKRELIDYYDKPSLKEGRETLVATKVPTITEYLLCCADYRFRYRWVLKQSLCKTGLADHHRFGKLLPRLLVGLILCYEIETEYS